MVAAASNPWRLLGLVVAARVALGVQFQAIGALGPALVAAEGGLAADYTALGALIGAYSLAGVAVALPAGWLMGRFGDRAVLLSGLGLMVAGGLLLAAAPGFATAMAGRLVAGAGATLLTTACAKLVLDAFAGPRLVTAMGVLLSAWPFGIGLALLLLPWFGDAWRAGLLASALLCAAALPALWRAVPDGRAAGAAVQRARLLPGEWWPLLTVGLLWASYNAAFAVALGFAPAFLTARGASAEAAGALASLIGWAILPLLPFGGAIAERLGRPGLISGACILGMAGAVLALAAGIGPAWLALAGFGLLSAPPASLIMAMLGRVLSPESRAFGLGLHYTMFYGAVALVPPLAGWARDATGAPAAPLLVAAAALGVSLAAQAGLGALLARRG